MNTFSKIKMAKFELPKLPYDFNTQPIKCSLVTVIYSLITVMGISSITLSK